MTTRCAWCGKLLKGDGRPPVSHGVCPKCAEKLNAEIDELEES